MPGTTSRTPPELTIRRARPADRTAMAAISARTWGGHDYAPRMFPAWLAHRRGELLVAEHRRTIAGFARTTVLAPGEVWLEGLRIAPRYRRRGFAGELARVQVERTRRYHARVVRYSTADINRASLAIGRTLGFRPARRFSFLTPRRPAVVTGPTVLRAPPFLVPLLWRFIARRAAGAGPRFVAHGWLFRELDRAHLAELVRQRRVFFVARERTIAGVMISVPGHGARDRVLYVGFLDAPADLAAALLACARAQARLEGYDRLNVVVPAAQRTRIRRLGLRDVFDFHAIILMEKRCTR